ncbi:hypothetical protein F53441_3068 [Fusarium austroafricanum]|uniref:Fucose-specific lectin n=1 Tax=Fusarium austroafricanum TaxID=2364996 RepID=A0A8H4P393_9HYPO|nr:hypothetical protein F53441_3068 [Fusarium austroafricanum]
MLSWLFIVVWIQLSYSAALYAYFTDRTVQVGGQDPATGKIHYSNCNSDNIPIFPLEKPNILETKEAPRNGTALAAAGWWNSQAVVASIFWQTKDDTIVNGFYTCDMKTGKLMRNGEWLISETADVDSVHNETGLSVVLLGAKDGYRVFYHNEDRQVMMMTYNDETNWLDGGAVSQDFADGIAIGSANYDKDNITVAFPRGLKDIEISRLQKTDTWKLDAFPNGLLDAYTNESYPQDITASGSGADFSLPAWNSSLQAIGSAVDRSRNRSVFYIGNDRKLYEVAAQKDEWELAPNRSRSQWPLADYPSSDLAVVSQQSEGKAWIYYWANKTIVQAYKNYDGEWEDAQALPRKNATNKADDKKSKDVSQNEDESGHSEGLGTGAKAGIGVGVGAGALLLLGVAAWLWMRRRKDRARKNEASDGTEVAEVGGTPLDSPMTGAKEGFPKESEAVQPSEVDGQGRPAELDHRDPAVHELPGHHARE